MTEELLRDAHCSGILDLYDCLVDPRVGIIRRIVPRPREAGGPAFFHYAAEVCRTEAIFGTTNFPYGGGASTNRQAALAKTIGESVERYCAAACRPTDFPPTTYQAARFRCVHPDEFALYSSRQYAGLGFPYRPFLEDTPVRWAPMRDLATEEQWHVPAVMIYLTYWTYEEDETAVTPSISTGLACHSDPVTAALNAVCEVVERDALAIFWQAAISPPRIRLETLAQEGRDLVQRFEEAGYEVSLFDITTDVPVPVILSVASNESAEAPALAFASAAATSPRVALRKCLEELAHTRRYCYELSATQPPLPWDSTYRQVVDERDHVHLWCDHAHAPFAEFLFLSTEQRSFGEIGGLETGDSQSDLEELVGQLSAAGYSPLLADLTTSDIAELGLTVVRAIIPGFHPIFMGHNVRALGGTRLWNVPRQLGYQGIDPTVGDNPVPHPLP